MQLDMDCVRDILLCVEKNTGLHDFCQFVDCEPQTELEKEDVNNTKIPPYQDDLTNQYGNNKLIYHVRYCVQADLLVRLEVPQADHLFYIITDLSPKGHEFLANSRDKNNWTQAKEIGLKIGSFGLVMASKITEGLATAGLKQLLGL